jgi:hypothetical protein
MQLNVAVWVELAGFGAHPVEDLIEPAVGHWYVINAYGNALNDARQLAVQAQEDRAPRRPRVRGGSVRGDLGRPGPLRPGSAGRDLLRASRHGRRSCTEQGGEAALRGWSRRRCRSRDPASSPFRRDRRTEARPQLSSSCPDRTWASPRRSGPTAGAARALPRP